MSQTKYATVPIWWSKNLNMLTSRFQGGNMRRGLVKLKKSKNPTKTQNNQTITTHPPIHCLFLETWKQHTKKHKKHSIYKKKLYPSWGLTHPPTSDSRIFGFFLTWQNPLWRWLQNTFDYFYLLFHLGTCGTHLHEWSSTMWARHGPHD